MRELIKEIERKAPPEYKEQRHTIYNELEKKLPQNHYHVVLGIIYDGYLLLKEDPTIGIEIRREVWNFNKRLQRITKKENQKLAEKYPEWFNYIRLQVQLSHPFFSPPPNYRPKKHEIILQEQLADYLKPCYAKKIEAARKIAEIFHFFYGLTYPEIDPENIEKAL